MNSDGTSTLCLRLSTRYIDKFGQLSLKCSRIQKWPFEYTRKYIGQNEKNPKQITTDNNETNWNDDGTNFLENIGQHWNTTAETTIRSFGVALLPIAALMLIIIAGG